jgi:hypothetical protein
MMMMMTTFAEAQLLDITNSCALTSDLFFSLPLSLLFELGTKSAMTLQNIV